MPVYLLSRPVAPCAFFILARMMMSHQPIHDLVKNRTLRDLLLKLAQTDIPQLDYPDLGVVLLMPNPETGRADFLSLGISPKDARSLCEQILAYGIPIDRKD